MLTIALTQLTSCMVAEDRASAVLKASGLSRRNDQSATAIFGFNLCAPVVPFHPFWGEGSQIDYRKKGTLTLTFLLENLATFWVGVGGEGHVGRME